MKLSFDEVIKIGLDGYSKSISKYESFIEDKMAEISVLRKNSKNRSPLEKRLKKVEDRLKEIVGRRDSWMRMEALKEKLIPILEKIDLLCEARDSLRFMDDKRLEDVLLSGLQARIRSHSISASEAVEKLLVETNENIERCEEVMTHYSNEIKKSRSDSKICYLEGQKDFQKELKANNLAYRKALSDPEFTEKFNKLIELNKEIGLEVNRKYEIVGVQTASTYQSIQKSGAVFVPAIDPDVVYREN